MTFSRSSGKRLEGLAQQFRSALDSLVGLVPLTAASVSVRPREEGPLEVLYTCGFEGTVDERGLAIGGEALRWLETHRRELVLAVRSEHKHVRFYRPFVEHGIRTAIIAPIFRGGRLAGTLTVASSEQDAYTARHLQLIRMMSARLTPFFAKPVPPARAFVASEEKPGSWGPGRPHPVVHVQKPPTEARGGRPAPSREAEAPGEQAHIEADPLGRIAEWDEVAEDLFGWSRSEVIDGFLTLFWRRKRKHLLDPGLLDELLEGGVFRGRAICYDREGLPVTCEVELSGLARSSGPTRAFRGRFRRVRSETLLPREEIEFGFARLYDFSNPLTDR